jgi:hypothetical protein
MWFPFQKGCLGRLGDSQGSRQRGQSASCNLRAATVVLMAALSAKFQAIWASTPPGWGSIND